MGTLYEQLIGKLMDGEGDPGKARVATAARAEGRWQGAYWTRSEESTLVPKQR